MAYEIKYKTVTTRHWFIEVKGGEILEVDTLVHSSKKDLTKADSKYSVPYKLDEQNVLSWTQDKPQEFFKLIKVWQKEANRYYYYLGNSKSVHLVSSVKNLWFEDWDDTVEDEERESYFD